MKIKNGWVLTEMDGDYVVVPTGESAESFHGIIRLNETGKDIWEFLSSGLDEEKTALKLLDLYDGIDIERAKAAVLKVAEKLKAEGILAE